MLGSEHRQTLIALRTQVIHHLNQNRSQDAEGLGVQLTETFARAFGQEDPDTLESSTCLLSPGRREQAGELRVQIFGIFKRVLSPTYPSTLSSMFMLAINLRSSGRDETALQLLTEFARLSSQTFGPDHPDVIDSMSTHAEWSSGSFLS